VTDGGDAQRPLAERALAAWTVRESRTLVRDRWLSLRAQTVVTGEGAVLEPFYLLDFPDWAQVVALTPDDRIVLVRQYRHGIGRVTLELPGGIVDPGESPLDAASRELVEETGYVAAGWRLVCSLSPNTSSHTNRCHTVLALGARLAQATAHEAGEEIAVETVPLAELWGAIAEGALPQAMHTASLAAALAAAGRLRLAPP
jgi:8-oxo-dGTP pyrophosphatase MutT (NUDIX family)